VLSAIIWLYQVQHKIAEGDRLIDYSTSLRPTRNRLLTAMGISACAVALLLALLGSFVDFVVRVSKPGIEHGEPLTIHIRKGTGEEKPSSTTGNRAVRSLPQEQVVSDEFAEIQQELAPDDSPEPPADSPPVKDWLAIADEAANASVDEYYRQEEIRASMWRRTHSMMFQLANDIVVKDEEPILSDVRFKRRSRVVGLGINVGSCFIGIPIVGVPVEERSIGIPIFVCSQNSG